MSVTTTATSITVAYGALVSAARAAAAPLNGRPGHALSDHLLLTKTAEGLSLRGTGSIADVVHTLAADSVGVDWRAAVHGRTLIGLLSAALSGSTKARMARVPVAVSRVDGGLAVTIGERAAITVPTSNVDVTEWPAMPEPTDTVVSTTRDELVAAVKATMHAADHTGHRVGLPMLAAIQVAVDGAAMTLSATDRYRLATTGPIPVGTLTPAAVTSALPDARAMLAVARSLPAGPVHLALAASDGAEVSPSLHVAAPGVAASLSSTTTQYVRWQRLFPAEFAAVVEVDRRALQAAVELQAAVTRHVLLDPAADALRVEASGRDAGEGNVDVVDAPQIVHYGQAPTGAAPSALINPAYLIAALKAAPGDTVAVGFDARDSRPLTIAPVGGLTGPGYRALIMPARKVS